jgi:hypothetical protein
LRHDKNCSWRLVGLRVQVEQLEQQVPVLRSESGRT